MKKTIAILICLLTVSFKAALVNTELYTEASAAGLANESNSKGSWNNNYYLTVETSDVANGNYALRINRSGSYSTSTYSFATTAGETYTLTGKIKVNTQNQQFISMMGFTNVQTDQGRTPTTSWATFTYTAEAQGSSASIRIGASNGGGNSSDYLLLDAVSIKQGLPDVPTSEDNTPYEAPAVSDQNYILKRTYQDSVNSIDEVSYRRQVLEEIQYFDGLGRPMQQIAVQQSPAYQDIITPIIYDDYGRQAKEFLPYPSQQSTPSHGSYRNNAIDSTNTYYLNTYSADLNSSAPNPFSESLLENSPMNRVQKQAAPGYDWRMGGGHEVEFNYQNNTAGAVRLFKVVFTGSNTEQPILSGNGTDYYLPGTLTKTITKDENHPGSSTKLYTTEEFKDKQNRVVLKRTYAEVGSPSVVEEHDTYYIYDDYGNLTYVLPPKVDTSNGVSNTELSELCYQYKYDHRNRLVEKQIPGKTVEYIVYNELDQPVFTQDANLRQQNKWLFTKYDAFGRVIQTGFYSFTGNRQALITAMDNYYLSGSHKVYEQKSGNSYTNQSYPMANTELLTENYYDNYTFDLGGLTLPVTSSLDNPLLSGSATKGLTTGSKVKVLETSNWITTITGYDKRRRPVYIQSSNTYLDTEDIAETKLDFIGKTLQLKTRHTKGSNAAIEVTENFSYDTTGRLLTQTHSVGSQTELLTANEYDKIGQLARKNIGNTLSSPLQQVDYQYTIRGWLKEINDVNSLGSDLFGFKIGYNEGTNALYNGNISSSSWRTANTDNNLKNYNYSYDALNRITGAIDNLDRYSLSGVAYDKNGNILRLTRKGAIVDNPVAANSSHFGTMDILTYHYDGSSNRLRKVTDAATIDKYGFKDDAVNTSTDPTNDYYYDGNGNMLSDTNKGIGISAHIAYNHLNLPTQVPMPNGTISYIYDAAGMKLSKIVNNTAESSVTSTVYAGNYIYEDGSLRFFNMAEGYIEPVISNSGEISSFDYVYQYKDHLGNVRLSYSDDDGNGSIVQAEIREENNYYPFGLEHRGYNNVINGTEHPYTYNGKENNKELGLNWHDFGARNYDASLGRWMNVDPLAELYHTDTPYAYVLNNPLSFIDPDGREVIGVTKDDAKKVHDDLNTVFADSKFDALRGLLTRGKRNNKKKFDAVDGDALKSALSGLSGDDLVLAELVTGAINSKAEFKVEFSEKTDNLSTDGTSALNTLASKLYTDNGLKAPTNLPTTRTGKDVEGFGGSGLNVPTTDGSHSFILEGTGVSHPLSRRELTTLHEVFGHGVPSAKKTSHKINSENAVRTENLVRRVMGIKQQRDGTNHGAKVKIQNPSALPIKN